MINVLFLYCCSRKNTAPVCRWVGWVAHLDCFVARELIGEWPFICLYGKKITEFPSYFPFARKTKTKTGSEHLSGCHSQEKFDIYWLPSAVFSSLFVISGYIIFRTPMQILVVTPPVINLCVELGNTSF